MSDQAEERRGATRYAVIMEAQATDLLTRSTFKMRCSDLSLSGCYLDTLNPIETGAPLWVHLEHGQRVFECQAKVAYLVSHLGMGVEFAQPIPDDQLEILTAWLSEAAGQGHQQASLFGASVSR
jgi:hypothetical protein